MENSKTVGALNDLIQITNDRIEGFKKVDRQVFKSNPALDEEYGHMLTQSENMKSELSALIQGKGGDVAETSTIAAGLHRTWIELKNSLTGDKSEATLEDVVFGEKAAVEAYESALGDGDLDAKSVEVVQTQLQQIRTSYQKFSTMEKN